MSEKLLLVSSYAGLANRLQVFIASVHLAQQHNHRLICFWEQNIQCGCLWQDLFLPPHDFTVLGKDVQGLKGKSSQMKVKGAMDRAILDTILYKNTGSVHLVANDLGHTSSYGHIFAANFIPLLPIRETVEQFRNQFRRRMIGVHIRRGDFHTANPSTMKGVREYLDLVEDQLAYHQQHDETGVFLATDDGSTVALEGEAMHEGIDDLFRNRFGDRLVVYPKRSLERNTVAAIQDALVDLLLLQATDVIVGTRLSSFSRFAAVNKPLLQV